MPIRSMESSRPQSDNLNGKTPYILPAAPQHAAVCGGAARPTPPIHLSRVTGEMEKRFSTEHVHGPHYTWSKKGDRRRSIRMETACLGAQPEKKKKEKKTQNPLNYALERSGIPARRAHRFVLSGDWPDPRRTGDGQFGPNVNRLVDGLSEAGSQRIFRFAIRLPLSGTTIGRHPLETARSARTDRRSRYCGVDLQPACTNIQTGRFSVPRRIVGTAARTLNPMAVSGVNTWTPPY